MKTNNNDTEIKIYSDVYAKPEQALVGYKGKFVESSGVFYCPYHKPNFIMRIFRKIRGYFIKPKVEPL